LEFVQRAMLSAALSGITLGALSPLVLARRMAFFSAAIGQAALTGVSLGVLLGEPVEAPWASVLGFSLLCGIALVVVRRRSSLPPDTVVGVLLALTLGLGVLLLTVVTKRFNVHQLEAAMFGSILTTTWADVLRLCLVAALVALGLSRTFNQLLIDTTDPRLVPPNAMSSVRLELFFVTLLTMAVVVSLKVTGALMVEALLLVPAAIGRNVAQSARGVMAVSVAAAVLCGIGGVVVSTWLNAPSGATIVLLLAAAFGLSLVRRRPSHEARQDTSALGRVTDGRSRHSERREG
jgi:zinc transport system permease protein